MERYCKQCHFMIKPSSLNKDDLMAHAKDFCSPVCLHIHEDEKEYLMKQWTKEATQ